MKPNRTMRVFVSWMFLATVLCIGGCSSGPSKGGGNPGGGGFTPNLQPPRFAYVANNADYTISEYAVDAASGQLRLNGYALSGGTDPFSIAATPSGKFLYVANTNSSDISAFTIDPNNGTLTPGSTIACGGTTPYSIVVDPTGKFVFVANFTSADVSAFTIDPNSGALTSVGPTVPVGVNPATASVDPSGKFLFVGDNTNITDFTVLSINATSGFNGGWHHTNWQRSLRDRGGTIWKIRVCCESF